MTLAVGFISTTTRADARPDVAALGAARASVAAVSVVRDWTVAAALRDEWQALCGRSNASLFNGPEWIEPWVKYFGKGREPFILTARDDAGALIGVMPLSIEPRRAVGRRVRRLAFLADSDVFGDYMDCVYETGREQEVLDAFTAELLSRSGEWDVLDLRDMDSESPTVAALARAFDGPRWIIERREGEACPCTPLDPAAGFDAFLKGTSRRDNYLRRRKWLEKQDGFCIERVCDVGQVPEHLRIFLRLHAMRWEGQAGGIRGPRLEAFHNDVVRRLATRGQVQLFTMRVGGAPVASMYGLCDGRRFLYYNAGYDPAWASRSVGLVLIGETFRAAIEQGLTEYDFLRGDETYKTDWVAQRRQLLSLRVHARGGRGAWLGRDERCRRALRRVIRRVRPGTRET